MQTTEIIEKTKHLFCYGEEDDGLARRIEYARTMNKGEIAVEFGIGNGRTGLILAMANPDIYVFTFDQGRRDVDDEDLLIRSIEYAHALGVYKYIPLIGEAIQILPLWKKQIAYLGIDTDGHGTGDQLRRWAPFVRSGGKIFIQNYRLDKYPLIKEETDVFLAENQRYICGVRTPEDGTNVGVQEVDVV